MNDQNFNQQQYVPPIIDPVPSPDGRRLDLCAAFRSGLFLALCVLMTISTCIGSFSFNVTDIGFGYTSSISLLPLLLTIGMWITYVSAGNGQVKTGGLKLMSGTLLANNILLWIAFALAVVLGVLFIVCGIMAPASEFEGFTAELHAELIEELPEARELIDSIFTELLEGGINIDALIPTALLILGIIVTLIGVVGMILILLVYRRMHRLAKSLVTCANDPDALPVANGCAVAMLVMGILNIFSGLTGIIMIISYVFIKNNLEPKQD